MLLLLSECLPLFPPLHPLQLHWVPCCFNRSRRCEGKTFRFSCPMSGRYLHGTPCFFQVSIPVPPNQCLSWSFLFTVAHVCTHTSFFLHLPNFVFLAGTYEHMNSTAYVFSCCCSVENASSVKVGTGFVKLITLFTTPDTDRFSIIISEWRMERINKLCPTDLTGGCQFS